MSIYQAQRSGLMEIASLFVAVGYRVAGTQSMVVA
jgi:hypothetical protein